MSYSLWQQKHVCSGAFHAYVYGTKMWSEIAFIMNPTVTQAHFGFC